MSESLVQRRVIHLQRTIPQQVDCAGRTAGVELRMPMKGRRSETGEVRWQTAGAVIGIAVMLAVIAGAAEFLSTNYRPYPTFAQAILHMLPPWLLMAALIPAVRFVVLRCPLIGGRFPALLVFPLHMVFACAFAFCHYAMLGAYQQWTADGVTESYLAGVLGLLDDYLVMDIAMYWAAAGAFSAIEYQRVLRQRDVAAAELRASLSDARLQALQAQLHPHFLFNALNTVAMQVRQGLTTEAVTMLSELSELFRDLLEDAPAAESTLENELEIVRRYLGIEQIRFGDRLRIGVEVEPGLESARVPTLLLQPVVENAIRHGVSRRAGRGEITVVARRQANADRSVGRRGADDRLRLEVHDNGPGLPEGFSLEVFSGVGLRNTQARLNQLYADAWSFDLSGNGGGTVAAITLPLRVAPEALRPA